MIGRVHFGCMRPENPLGGGSIMGPKATNILIERWGGLLNISQYLRSRPLGTSLP